MLQSCVYVIFWQQCVCVWHLYAVKRCYGARNIVQKILHICNAYFPLFTPICWTQRIKQECSCCFHFHSGLFSSVLVVSRWLWPGNWILLKVASMVATWWIVVCVCCVSIVTTWNCMMPFLSLMHLWRLDKLSKCTNYCLTHKIYTYLFLVCIVSKIT